MAGKRMLDVFGRKDIWDIHFISTFDNLHNCQRKNRERNEAQFTELVACKLSHLPRHPAMPTPTPGTYLYQPPGPPCQLPLPSRFKFHFHFHIHFFVFLFFVWLGSDIFELHAQIYFICSLFPDHWHSLPTPAVESLDHIRISLYPHPLFPFSSLQIYIFMKFPFFQAFLQIYTFVGIFYWLSSLVWLCRGAGGWLAVAVVGWGRLDKCVGV